MNGMKSNTLVAKNQRITEANRIPLSARSAHAVSSVSASKNAQTIARSAVIADSIGNLLGAYHLLLPGGQVDALAVSTSLADTLAQLNVGGAR